MKFISILTVSILLISCSDTSSQNQQLKQSDEDWEISSHTFTTNTYTQAGLLDSSYKTMLLYEMGILTDTIKSVVVRKYENNRLINEKEFTIEKDGSKTLSSEIIKKYDLKENMITQIYMMDSNLLSKTTSEYNNKGQAIKSMSIFRKTNNNTNDFILDSAVVHLTDKRHFEYDTIVSTIEYDSQGNAVHSTEFNTKGIIQKTSITQYSGKSVTFSCDLNSQGDTIATITCSNQGKLNKQIVKTNELNDVDTIWLDKNKVVKLIGHHGKFKNKDETIYNSKGDEIESVSYK